MAGECVYDCIHPLWGGGGTCISDDGNSVCECDAGYASQDSRGNASCVPRRVLVSVYLMVGMVSLLTAALTVWNISQYRHLPVRVQSARKTSIRLRALVSTSVYLLGFVSIGFALAAQAGDAGYSSAGFLQVNYIVLTPALMFGVAMIADYWVECLPSQLLSSGSCAGMLKRASEASSAFVVVGLANGAPISALGVAMAYFQDWPQFVADLAIGAGIICAGAVIIFVATQTSAAITRAMSKGSASSRAFYQKARNNLRLQAVTLCAIAVAGVAVTVVKQLTLAGRSTPIIAWTAQILCGHAGAVVFSLATRFEAATAASNSPLAAASVEIQSFRSSTATAISGVAVAAQTLLLEQGRKLTVVPGAAHTLLLEQGRRKLTFIRPPAGRDGKRGSVRKGAQDGDGDTKKHGAAPTFDAGAGIEPETCVKSGAQHRRDSRSAQYTARVWPIEEDIPPCDTRDRDTRGSRSAIIPARVTPVWEDISLCGEEKVVCSTRQDEWTVESMDNAEPR